MKIQLICPPMSRRLLGTILINSAIAATHDVVVIEQQGPPPPLDLGRAAWFEDTFHKLDKLAIAHVRNLIKPAPKEKPPQTIPFYRNLPKYHRRRKPYEN